MARQNSYNEAEILLKSTSIECFIKYFEVFEKQYSSRDNSVIYDHFRKNHEPWTENSYKSRATKGKKIFRENLEISALRYIINSANKNRLTQKPKKKPNDYCKVEKTKSSKLNQVFLGILTLL